MSKASIFKGKLVTSRCCLDDGLRRTGDWSEAGITLSCCCSVICSVSPDRHWLVLIMATRGAGGGLIRADPGPGTARWQTGGCRVNLHLLEPRPAALTASHHDSEFLCSHWHRDRGCVMLRVTSLNVEQCVFVWSHSKILKIVKYHICTLNWILENCLQ